MIEQWRTFLERNGAEFEQDHLVSFGNVQREQRATLGGDVICDLGQYRLLAVQGGEAESFLQGQLTNDVERLDETHSQLTGFCTPKGRLVSNFRLFRNGATIFAIIPAEMFDKTLGDLQRYVISADVQMGDATSVLAHFGCSGSKASEILEQKLGSLPVEINHVLQHEKHIVIKISEDRYEIFGSNDDCQQLWSQLDVHCTAVGQQCWESLNIRDGLPEISPATSEQFVPQMVNMDLVDAVSFDKGCYTGQEIVARTHYLGKQKRRLYRLKIQSDSAPQPGDELSTESSGDNQYTGTIINSQADALAGYEALAVVQIKDTEDSSLQLKGKESSIKLQRPDYMTADQG